MTGRRSIVIGPAILALFALAAILGAVWTPYDPQAIDFDAALLPPGAAHWFGTDEFGRDVLSRLLRGSTSSIGISLGTVAFATVLGTIFGVIAGYARGIVDHVTMVFTAALLAFPGILLALSLLAVLGPGPSGIVIALGIAFTPSVTRIVRGQVLAVSRKEFVEASRVLGNSEVYTMVRHVLPNCIAPLTVLSTSMIGWALLSESALSFLGLGAPPPAPTWGNMLSAARPYLEQASWLGIIPGVTISLCMLGITLCGDVLRDLFDPRMRGMA